MPLTETTIPIINGPTLDAQKLPSGAVRECDAGNPPVNPQNPSFVQNPLTANASVNFSAGNVASGLIGYLERILVASTGMCIWTIFNGATSIGTLVTNANTATFDPPDKTYEQCAAGAAFSVTAQNAEDSQIAVYAKFWLDPF